MTGTTRWSDGTEMVTLDYSHLTSVLWGARKGFQARLDEVEAWQAQRGRRTHKKHGRRPQANHQGKAVYQDPSISREEVKSFLDGFRVNQDRRAASYLSNP